MQSLKRLLPLLPSPSPVITAIRAVYLSTTSNKKKLSSSSTADDDWNDAWESAWLPDEPSTVPPWEEEKQSSATYPSSSSASDAAAGDGAIDANTKAFVAEMDERWTERRGAKKQQRLPQQQVQHKLTSKDEYRLRKQRIHAGLWMKEIDKLEESRLGNPNNASADDIDRLLDSCSEIFDSGTIELTDSKIPSTSELKTKPDGWETTLKTQDGNIWDISQREEDILLQEFERRIAFSKFQIASFIKTHIFSRRRPIDGWKYMIEELGPNARKGKGSVQRLPSLADPSTQPFKEERPSIPSHATSFRGRRK